MTLTKTTWHTHVLLARIIMVALCVPVAVMSAAPVAAEAVKTAVKVAEPDPESFTVLKKIKGDNKALAYDFLGRKNDVDVWLLSGPGIMQMVYVPKDGGGAIVGGVLMDAQGQALSQGMQEQFSENYPKRAEEVLRNVSAQAASKADATKVAGDNSQKETEAKPQATVPAEMMWQRLIQNSPAVFGPKDGVPVIVVVLDPAQEQTRAVWDKLYPLAQENRAQIRVMPLAMTSPDSILMIAHLTGNAAPDKVWLDMIGDGKKTAADVVQEHSEKLAADTADKLRAMIDLATVLKLRELPFFAYRGLDAEGVLTGVKVMRGQPKDWDAFLAQFPAEQDKGNKSR